MNPCQNYILAALFDLTGSFEFKSADNSASEYKAYGELVIAWGPGPKFQRVWSQLKNNATEIPSGQSYQQRIAAMFLEPYYFLPNRLIILHGIVLKDNGAARSTAIGKFDGYRIFSGDIHGKTVIITFPGENTGDSATVTLRLDTV